MKEEIEEILQIKSKETLQQNITGDLGVEKEVP